MSLKKNEPYLSNITKDEIKKGNYSRQKNTYPPFLTTRFIHKASKYIDFDSVKVVFDIGSRDCLQAIEFAKWFPSAQIYAFEPVPQNIEVCKQNIVGYDNIEIVPKALNSYTGKTSFFEVTTGNTGASSLYKISKHRRSRPWKQKKIEVDCIDISEWCRKNNIYPDLLWVDVQGAESIVFNTLKPFFKNIQAIATEIGLQRLYQGSTLKPELDDILKEDFFFCFGEKVGQNTEMDAIYINKKYKAS